MSDTFRLRLDDIQPSQLYISKAKYAEVLRYFDTEKQSELEPIPIKELDNELISTDGHTRGVAWCLKGYEEVDCTWEDSEMDWDEYRVCVKWCKDAGIHSMIDLKDRFLDHSEYEILWYERCRVMQEALEKQKGSIRR
jgi:hypothetical protein